jgi:hypothetical protein
LKALKDDFPPGTQIYKTTVSPAGSIEVLASATTIMLINKTASSITVSLNGNIVFLSPYEVSVLRGWPYVVSHMGVAHQANSNLIVQEWRSKGQTRTGHHIVPADQARSSFLQDYHLLAWLHQKRALPAQ